MDVNSLNKEYQQLKLDVIIGGCRVIPIGHANSIMEVPYSRCMEIKYTMYGYDWQTWRNTMYKRDVTRETKLFELLGIKGEYNLINTRFRSNETGIVPVTVDNGLQNIIMDNYEGYSLFDWSYVIENATNIHSVGTSICFLLELLDLKAKEIHMYKREPDEKDFKNYDYILQKHKYIYH